MNIKAVPRFEYTPYGMVEVIDGWYVNISDHEAAISELRSNHERVVGEWCMELMRETSELTDAREEIKELQTALAASRAEVEGLKKDAERWGHVRKLLTVDDIFNRQRELDAWQNLVSEEECERADKAIDTAMEKGNAS